MLVIIFLGLIAKLTSVSSDCVVRLQDVKLIWNKLRISLLTQYLEKAAF